METGGKELKARKEREGAGKRQLAEGGVWRGEPGEGIWNEGARAGDRV